MVKPAESDVPDFVGSRLLLNTSTQPSKLNKRQVMTTKQLKCCCLMIERKSPSNDIHHRQLPWGTQLLWLTTQIRHTLHLRRKACYHHPHAVLLRLTGRQYTSVTARVLPAVATAACHVQPPCCPYMCLPELLNTCCTHVLQSGTARFPKP